MKTAKEFIENRIDHWGQKEDIIEACIEYAKEAIKADRENLLKHVVPGIYVGSTQDEEKLEELMQIESLHLYVEETSIINAPMIELL